MITIVWDDVFHWVGMVVVWIICLTPLWMVLYLIFITWAFAGPPWQYWRDWRWIVRLRERRHRRRMRP